MDSDRLPNGSRWDEWGSTGEVAIGIPPKGHYVYVAWGAGDRPLYVGKSSNVLSRLGQHSRSAPWYAAMERLELRSFPTAADAEWAENEAIHALNPVHNVTRRMSEAQRVALRHVYEEELREKERQAAERRARDFERIQQALAERRAKPEPVRVQSPWQGRRRRRKGGDVFDIASPEQLEIIRLVQNRGLSA